MVPPRWLIAVCAVTVSAGCGGADSSRASRDAASATAAPDKPDFIVSGFKTPESVRYDPMEDRYFVSNINGNPSAKDNNGSIVRVTADGKLLDSVSAFIAGGAKGVTLNAPKGMAIVGDTLWVADIDQVRAFNRLTGAPIASVAVKGAAFLNDVAVGPDSAVYVTDSGIHFDEKGQMSHPGPDVIVKIAGRVATSVVKLDGQPAPNGIAWEAANARFLVNGFNTKALYAWTPGAARVDSIAAGPGGGDGLEVLGGGRVLYTSWADSSLNVYDGTAFRTVRKGLPSPADIGVDTKRGLVAVPLFNDNRVEIWRIPARP